MRRALIGMVAAFLTALIGVALAMIEPTSRLELSEYPAAVPAAEPTVASGRPEFADVFRDFDFVGSCSTAEAIGGSECLFPHGLKESLPKPAAYEAGRIYVFHYRGDIDSDLLFEALQTRLRSLGLETSVLAGVFSGMRLHPLGVDFQGRGYEGEVSKGLHRLTTKDGPQLLVVGSSSEVAEYVLRLSERPQ